MTRPIIAITMGDAAGVGPEVIMKSLAHAEPRAWCRPLVVGDANRLLQAGRIVGSKLKVRSLAVNEIERAEYDADTVDCIDLKLIPADLAWGVLSAVAGDAAYQYPAFSIPDRRQGGADDACGTGQAVGRFRSAPRTRI